MKQKESNVMDKEPQPFLWMNPREMLKISRKLGYRLSGCHLHLIDLTAETNGMILEHDAIVALTSEADTNIQAAREAISALIDAGMVTRNEDILTLKVYGTDVVPDYDDWC